jgi:hypothetical protein
VRGTVFVDASPADLPLYTAQQLAFAGTHRPPADHRARGVRVDRIEHEGQDARRRAALQVEVALTRVHSHLVARVRTGQAATVRGVTASADDAAETTARTFPATADCAATGLPAAAQKAARVIDERSESEVRIGVSCRECRWCGVLLVKERYPPQSTRSKTSFVYVVT